MFWQAFAGSAFVTRLTEWLHPSPRVNQDRWLVKCCMTTTGHTGIDVQHALANVVGAVLRDVLTIPAELGDSWVHANNITRTKLVVASPFFISARLAGAVLAGVIMGGLTAYRLTTKVTLPV